MECRKFLLLALSLLCTSLGCTASTAMLVPPPEAQLPSGAAQDAPAVKRKPKAETFVALGDYRETEAIQLNLSPQEQHQYHEQARKAYLQALQIDPNYLPAFTSLARMFLATDEPEKALDMYHKALKLHPKEAAVWFEMGLCFSRRKQWEPALESLNQAVKLDPDNRQFATTLGYCLARCGRYNDSVAVFTQLDGKALAQYKVARMAHHLKQDDLSKELLRRALLEKPDLVEANKMLQLLEAKNPTRPTLQASLEKEVNQLPVEKVGN